MFKNKLILLLLLANFVACQNEPKPTATNVSSPPPIQSAQQSNSDKMAELKAKAFNEDDHFGRVHHSMGLIQRQFDVSNKMNTPKGKQTISVDEQFTVIIRSEVNGDVYDTKFNLKNLNQQNGGMRLLPDNKPEELPGFAISVIEGKTGVEVSKNGKKTGEERELQIFMADRTLIEQALPAFLQALNVVHGRT